MTESPAEVLLLCLAVVSKDKVMRPEAWIKGTLPLGCSYCQQQTCLLRDGRCCTMSVWKDLHSSADRWHDAG